MQIDRQGWLIGVNHTLSPNYDQRPHGAVIDLLVIHNISLPPGEFGGSWISALFTNSLDCAAHPYFEQLRDVKVSAHILIRRDGEMIQYVSFNDRAWHAGVSNFQGRERCNDFSIGIELEGEDRVPYTDDQYRILDNVTRVIMQAYPAITTDRITGHSDIAPNRKTDPGPAFDWQRYLEKLKR